MFTETKLTEKSRAYAQHILSRLDVTQMAYHNISHTEYVVECAIKIGKEEGLDKKDMEALVIAAWFHDLGYVDGQEMHEERSAEMARQFLVENEAGEKKINKVTSAIISTKMPQNPQNLLEEVLCDADLYNLGSEDFFAKSERLRIEFNVTHQREISDGEWIKEGINFLTKHSYFTDYARAFLQPQKEKNTRKLEKKLEKNRDKAEKTVKVADLEKEISKLQKRLEEEKEKNTRYGRGVETLFRTTSVNHIELSSIADNKANIMISVNSIIVSLIVSVLFRKFEEFPNLMLPTIILVTVCLTTIVFAILATRPKITSGTFHKDDIHRSKTNLLFFGNFHKMTLEDYEWGMTEIMKDQNLLYLSMIQDIYYAGKVLGSKYYYIRISYNVFMYGFVFAIISFVVAMFFFPADA